MRAGICRAINRDLSNQGAVCTSSSHPLGLIMSESSALDIDALLAPIPGAKPAGDATAYSYRLREKLGNLRVEERPEDFDDATRPEQLKRADYPAVVRLATEALTSQSKDLRIVCHLIEALAKSSGFAGLRDGLCLLKRLIAECWDRLEPSIEDGDLDARSSPLANLLDDPDRGFCFPNTIRQLPVFAGQSVLSWQKVLTKKEPDDEKTIALVQAKATPQALAPIKEAIEGCLIELAELTKALDEQFKETSPGLLNLKKALEDAQRMVASLLPRSAAAPQASAAASPAADQATPSAVATIPASYVNVASAREAVYGDLTRAAETLAQLEPHSPIPYLVRRAVDLGKLPFPQLMQQLIREERILTDLQREFGLTQTT
jgi:type VI secretion system protein ImpA